MSNQLQRKLLELAGDSAIIVNSSQKDWSSISFEGRRHTITMQFANRDHANAFMDSVGWQGEDLIELTNGFTLCDLLIGSDVDQTAGHTTIKVEALTLKD